MAYVPLSRGLFARAQRGIVVSRIGSASIFSTVPALRGYRTPSKAQSESSPTRTSKRAPSSKKPSPSEKQKSDSATESKPKRTNPKPKNPKPVPSTPPTVKPVPRPPRKVAQKSETAVQVYPLKSTAHFHKVSRLLGTPGDRLLPPLTISRRGGRETYPIYNQEIWNKHHGIEYLPTPSTGNQPMKSYIQVVTTPTADTPGTALLLHFPDKRYIFGQISEGFQRACTERGVKFSYLTDVFLSGRMEWANTGGMIGVILTQADALASAATALEELNRERGITKGKGVKEEHGGSYAIRDGQLIDQRGHLTIHGGRNLAHTLATARRFVFRKGMPVFTKEYDSESMANGATDGGDPFETPSWSDSNIKVWAMPVSSSQSSSRSRGSSRSSESSARKRSLDEFQEKPTAMDRRAEDQITRQSIVNDMFNSTWRMDALTETPLAEVKMPAAMFVRNPETKDLEQYRGPAPGSDEPLPDINVFVRRPWPGATVERLPASTPCDEAVSYVVRSHDIRGKFDPKKAAALNIARGPDYARLTKGETVTSTDGKEITPDMVLGPARLGKGFAIVDLPTPDYVDGLVSRPEWQSPSVTTNLEAFVWILGPGVGDHPRLHEFVKSMSHCKHTVASSDYSPNYLSMASIARLSVNMARINKDNYIVPVHDNVTLPQPGTGSGKPTGASLFSPLESGLVINMEPKFELDRSEVVPLFNAASALGKMPRAVTTRLTTVEARLKKEPFRKMLAQYRQNTPGADAEIIALGTGSSSPSKYRNVSGTLVKVPGYGYYLLDAGENTLGQLKRIYNPEELREVLQNLRMVWISHLHADHHLGTASIIKAWYRENYPDGIPASDAIETDVSKILQEKRLFVVSDEHMTMWLEEYANVEDFGFGRVMALSAAPYNEDGEFRTKLTYRHCRADGTYPGHNETQPAGPQVTEVKFDDPNLRTATGLSNLQAVRVSHCRGAMALVLEFPHGFKVSFSGDCRPSRPFATIGKGSTVLIHEATFLDNMRGSAIAKKHSTVAEALEVGRLMDARAIVLTHFSQRYQKTSAIEPNHTAPPNTTKPGGGGGGSGQLVTPDIPDDNDNEPSEPTTPNPANRPITVYRSPKLTIPIVAAYDYMRIRVGDMPTTQSYAGVIDKLHECHERHVALMAEKQRLLREREEALLTEAKRSKHKGQHKAKTAEKQPEQQATALPSAGEIEEMFSKKEHAVWYGSESEDGWVTSDGEGGGR